MADEAACQRGFEQHGSLAGADLARPQAGKRPFARVAPERLGVGDFGGYARRAVPVVALHLAFLLGDH